MIFVGIDGFCSTTKYSPFISYLQLQNRLISNSHCSTYYNKSLYVCEGDGYWWSESEEDIFVYMKDDIVIVCCTIILNIFIIVIMGCLILNFTIHCNVCNYKGKYCAILWASRNYCGELDLVIPLSHCGLLALKLKCTPCMWVVHVVQVFCLVHVMCLR